MLLEVDNLRTYFRVGLTQVAQAVDGISFQLNQGKTLALVLTGMGSDGREGARELKKQGATIWSQDEASSVIYGMPMAVAEAGLSDQVLSLRDIGASLVQAAGN